MLYKERSLAVYNKTLELPSFYRVAAYIRLSKEDGDNLESNSITNQKDIIKQFIDNCPDMTIVEYYIDDGYSGTNFNRPAIKKLMDI